MPLLTDIFSVLTDIAAEVGAVTVFFGRLLMQLLAALLRPRLISDQIYNVGARSLIIIMICGLCIGGVLGLQSYTLLQRFGSQNSLGGGVALVLIRDLGPVMTALLFAARAGTSLASEIGLLRATDQLVAMDMMAVDSLRRVVAPRFLAGVISMPLLAMIFIVLAIFGVQLVAVYRLGVDQGTFWSQMRGSVHIRDLWQGIVKSGVFGVMCSLVAVYEGYTAEPTAEGVGRATTSTVVISTVLTLMLNYMIAALML